MEPAVDTSKLPPPAQKLLDPKTPAPMRQMAARGIAPGLKPADAVTVVAMLAESTDEALAKTAKETLGKLPPQLLAGALGPDLPAGVIELLWPGHLGNAETMQRFLVLPQITPATVAGIATRCSEEVAELVATNEQKLLDHPTIIEKLYMNKNTRMSTANRVLELAVRNKVKLEGIPAFEEAAQAIVEELIAEPTPEPNFDDVNAKEAVALGEALSAEAIADDTHAVDEQTGEETLKQKYVPLHVRLSEMTLAQKIRTAMVGSASERAILVRDSNRIVARAAVKSPQMQDAEILRIAGTRNVSDEVLTEIARSGRWTKSYKVKLMLVQNPRTPAHVAIGFISHMQEHDLKGLARSKNVTGPIQMAAKQQLQRKGKS